MKNDDFNHASLGQIYANKTYTRMRNSDRRVHNPRATIPNGSSILNVEMTIQLSRLSAEKYSHLFAAQDGDF
jgi:hypothetical protein